ncbi:MAG TPA: hypothetical protein ACFYD7_08880 [Candidatus Wujingus californicus]|uniref:hypothetical protein n=1 Tax=Candidatus Wujingus californicus TaxID=3367618 RepID=UPI001DAA892F|nr:hypothetical protein [Planctomycetota bacterium]
MSEPDFVKSIFSRLKYHGWFGAGLICFVEFCLLFQNQNHFALKISIWATPLCWVGYVMITDAIIFKLKGSSLLCNRRREFFVQMPLSIAFWLLFEFYNLHLVNWEYHGLPENKLELCIGMGLAYAMIMPGIFQTTELLESLRFFDRFRIANLKVSNKVIYSSVVLGFFFVMAPLLISRDYARFLFGLVWTGYVMIFEPIVYSSKGESLLRDLEEGSLARILNLFVAGYICGFLWEFWNFWAVSKWVYTAPFMKDVKIFEMPVAGFLGFGPFAWEYFCFYNFCKLIKRPSAQSPQI